MKIYELLDNLTKELESSKGVFFTSKKAVDVDNALRILEEIRMEIPMEIKKAKVVVDDQEKILSEAKAEAKAILEDANAKAYDIVTQAEGKAELLSSDHEITRKAYEKAQAINDAANQNAEDVVTGSRDYASDVLSRLERQMETQLQAIRQTRDELKN